MEVKAHAGLQGYFTLQRRNANDELIEEIGEFPNIVLDTGLDRMAQGAWLGACAVGTSNTPPTESDSALGNAVARTTNMTGIVTSVQNTTLPYYQEVRQTYRFAMGAAAGTLAEVGVGWGTASTGGDLFDRALIKDTLGNPTTITILSNEFLDVVFTLRIYYSETDKTEDFQLVDETDAVLMNSQVRSVVQFTHAYPNTYNSGAGKMWNTAVRCVRYDGYYGVNESYAALWSAVTELGSEKVAASGTTGVSGWGGQELNSSAVYTYPDNRTVIYSSTIPIDKGNGNVQGGYFCTNLGYVKFKLTEPVTKNNTETLTIRLKLTWGRYLGGA